MYYSLSIYLVKVNTRLKSPSWVPYYFSTIFSFFSFSWQFIFSQKKYLLQFSTSHLLLSPSTVASDHHLLWTTWGLFFFFFLLIELVISISPLPLYSQNTLLLTCLKSLPSSFSHSLAAACQVPLQPPPLPVDFWMWESLGLASGLCILMFCPLFFSMGLNAIYTLITIYYQ